VEDFDFVFLLLNLQRPSHIMNLQLGPGGKDAGNQKTENRIVIKINDQ
jgi:hypothetical protein